jgi:hypothetical protein
LGIHFLLSLQVTLPVDNCGINLGPGVLGRDYGDGVPGTFQEGSLAMVASCPFSIVKLGAVGLDD